MQWKRLACNRNLWNARQEVGDQSTPRVRLIFPPRRDVQRPPVSGVRRVVVVAGGGAGTVRGQTLEGEVALPQHLHWKQHEQQEGQQA